MGFYEDRILPYLIDVACGQEAIANQRAKVVPLAEGNVLEVGAGAGHNFPFYDPARIERVFALEPSRAMRGRAAPRIARAPFEIEWIDLPGERIPLADASVDTVLLTYTLCTIPDHRTALAGMRRVLRPGGKLVFLEHGAAPDARGRTWQDRIDPLWTRLAGGCHLNREIRKLIEDAGFAIVRLEAMYVRGVPKIAGFQSWGYAAPA
jgi:ubiquinone/menaquinone biosynthesis C-methylase UbiE